MAQRIKSVTELQAGVLVIGSGGAALRAALAAFDEGADVLIVSKGEIAKSGATYFSVAEVGAYNVPDGSIDPTDSPDVFYNDILDAALGMADPKLARIVADEAASTKQYLESCGMKYAHNEDGSYMGYKACFSSKPRSHVVENHFKPIVAALGAKVKEKGIRTMAGITVTNLLLEDGACRGAFAVQGDELFVIRAGAVILAVGGASTLFARNMYPGDITGDGYAMAYRAGATIANMEFIQAGIGLSWPEVNLFGNQLWETMPRITNGKGERFIPKYIEGDYTEEEVITAKGGHFPFSTRDISRFVEISVQREIHEGAPTERGNVYLDFLETDFEKLFSKPGSRLKAMWPLTYDRFSDLGVDLYKEKIEIACFAHAINGGVLIDENAESTLPGLYAAGEVAAGPHGADRLGGNMSVTSQVFGRRAGVAAAKRAAGLKNTFDVQKALAAEKEFLESFGTLSSSAAEEILSTLRHSADDALLIVRTGEKIERLMDTIKALRARVGQGEGEGAALERSLDLNNLFTVGELIANSALRRKESRGSHYRMDFPELDPNLSSPIYHKK